MCQSLLTRKWCHMSDDGYTRITLRIPNELDELLNESSRMTSRSKNADIVARLQQSFSPPAADVATDRMMKMIDRLQGMVLGLVVERDAETGFDTIGFIESLRTLPEEKREAIYKMIFEEGKKYSSDKKQP